MARHITNPAPGANGIGLQPRKGGHVWHVDNEQGGASTTGAPSAPLSTIQAALDLASPGDVIVVHQTATDYEENLVVATPHLRLVAMAPSGWRVTNAPATGRALHVTTGTAFYCSGFQFHGADATLPAVEINADGVGLDNCDVMADTADGVLLVPANDDDTASEGFIRNSWIRDCAGKGIRFKNPGAPGAPGIGPTAFVIEGCRFFSNAAEDIFDEHVAGGNDVTFGAGCAIRGCSFEDASKATYIDLNAGSSNLGVVEGNRFNDAAFEATNAIKVVAATGIVGNVDRNGIFDSAP